MALEYACLLRAEPSEDPSLQLERVAQIVGDWAQVDQPLTDTQTTGRRGGHVSTEVLGSTADPEWAWRFRLQHPDDRDSAVVWTVSVTGTRSDHIEVAIRLDRTRVDGAVTPQRGELAPPRFVEELIEADDLVFVDGGRRLDTSVWVVRVPEAEAFSNFVRSPTRLLPVFALTPRDEDAIDGGMLLPKVLGLAHVALIRSETSWELNNWLPRGLNVYGGAARLLWPGVTDASSRWDHDLWTADIQARRLEQAAITKVLDAGRSASTTSALVYKLDRKKRDARTERLLDELAEARALFSVPDQDDGVAPSAPSDDRVREAEERAMAALKADRDEALDLAIQHEREAVEARDRASNAERERDYLRGEVERLRSQGRSSGSDVGNDDELVAQIQAEVDDRGEIDGAVNRPFALGSVFSTTLIAQGDQYRTKTVRACADVVIGSPGLLARRDDHPLRVGAGGNDPAVTRMRDGAEARRCTLEQNTPAARRLHYWRLADGSVEFASVSVHSDTSIPE